MRPGGTGPERGRRLPSHGTIVAYVALFVALGGTGLAATNVGHVAGGVKVTCSATRDHKRIGCKVVGKVVAKTLNGPLTLTESPAYTFDPNNDPGYLVVPFRTSTPDRYFSQQYTIAEDSNPETDLQNDVYTTLLSPSELGGSTMHISKVQFCIDISPNSNTGFHGTSEVSVDKATVYQLDEPNPSGGAGSGTAGPPLAYSTPVALLQETYKGETDIDSCLTASASKPAAINPSGYLIFAITLGITDSGVNNNTFGTNYIQFGRVTATYTP